MWASQCSGHFHQTKASQRPPIAYPTLLRHTSRRTPSPGLQLTRLARLRYFCADMLGVSRIQTILTRRRNTQARERSCANFNFPDHQKSLALVQHRPYLCCLCVFERAYLSSPPFPYPFCPWMCPNFRQWVSSSLSSSYALKSGHWWDRQCRIYTSELLVDLWWCPRG